MSGGLACLLALASAAAPAATVGRVASADGVPIAYEVAGRGDPALVFIHGWSCDRSHWAAQVPAFSKSHRVVALDLAGHGESGRGRKAWTIEAFGEDVRAVVERLDLPRVVLVGHSLGGPVALEAARLMPQRVAGVIGVDTLHDVERSQTKEEREAFLAPWRADYKETLARLGPVHLFRPWNDPALVRRILAQMSSAPPDVALPLLEASLDYDAAKALARSRVPIHLLNADLHPTDLAAARRHAPRIDLTLIAGASHFAMIEDPVEFNRLLARVIRELDSSRPGVGK